MRHSVLRSFSVLTALGTAIMFTSVALAGEMNVKSIEDKTNPKSVPGKSANDILLMHDAKLNIVEFKNDALPIKTEKPYPVLPEKVQVPAGKIFPFDVTLVDVKPGQACANCIAGVYVSSKYGSVEMRIDKNTGELSVGGQKTNQDPKYKREQLKIAMSLVSEIANKTGDSITKQVAELLLKDLKIALSKIDYREYAYKEVLLKEEMAHQKRKADEEAALEEAKKHMKTVRVPQPWETSNGGASMHAEIKTIDLRDKKE